MHGHRLELREDCAYVFLLLVDHLLLLMHLDIDTLLRVGEAVSNKAKEAEQQTGHECKHRHK